MAGLGENQPPERPEEQLEVAGTKVDIVRQGSGPTLLYLHSVDGVSPEADFFKGLCENYEVIAPWHPGFGHSERPEHFKSVGDLAYFYLDLIKQLDLQDITLVGASFGGWLALEIAVRDVSRISKIILVDSLGVKFAARDERDILDMHAVSQDVLADAAYHDASARTRDYSQMDDWSLYNIARSREAYTYFGWKPYMHNPTLKDWLHRIEVPTLVLWGASDGIVTTEYGSQLADRIPNAAFDTIAEAGHYPHIEQPAAFLEKARGFLNA